MQNYQSHATTLKSYRVFDGDEWRDSTPDPQPQPQPQRQREAVHFSLPGASCCAYTLAGNICGRRPAPFLDLQRGGLVCEDHKPKGGGS